jgi:hypothetical protein
MVLGASAYGATGDGDNDGIPDSSDNCPAIANPDQADRNANTVGDACDDPDKDGLSDQYELYTLYGTGPNFRRTNPDKRDTDGDGLSDGSEINRTFGPADHPRHTDPTLRDTDADGWEDGTEIYAGTDPTDADTDDDGVKDSMDNCAKDANSNQRDRDGDGLGDACDSSPGAGDPTEQAQNTVDDTSNQANQAAADVIAQVGGLVDVRPLGDVNKMASDGYVLKITQASNSYWLLQAVKASDGSLVALNLPDLGSTYSVNGPVAVFAYSPANKTSPAEGERINVRWRYSARRKQLLIRVLKGTIAHDGAVTFAVQPVGYPQTGDCRSIVIPGAANTCDGFAMGFYNPLKLSNPQDLLDAVPYRTTISY